MYETIILASYRAGPPIDRKYDSQNKISFHDVTMGRRTENRSVIYSCRFFSSVDNINWLVWNARLSMIWTYANPNWSSSKRWSFWFRFQRWKWLGASVTIIVCMYVFIYFKQKAYHKNIWVAKLGFSLPHWTRWRFSIPCYEKT